MIFSPSSRSMFVACVLVSTMGLGISSSALAAPVYSQGAFASTFIGGITQQLTPPTGGCFLNQCNQQAFDTTNDAALAPPSAAVSSVISGSPGPYDPFHGAAKVNDGFYGNGSSWIGNTANSWLKIDLGEVNRITGVMFGRDRLGNFNDRDPGVFKISFASSDNVYANGDATNDVSEYVLAFTSTDAQGVINPAQNSIKIDFSSAPINARYVKMEFANSGAGIDEVEVFVPEPASLALLGLGLAGLGFSRHRKQKLAA